MIILDFYEVWNSRNYTNNKYGFEGVKCMAYTIELSNL